MPGLSRGGQLAGPAPQLLAILSDDGTGSTDTRATVIDERLGTYQGVGIGDSAADVRRVFGDRPFAGANESLMPTDSDFVDDGGPWAVHIPQRCGTGRHRRSPPPVLRYPDASFLLCEERVYTVAETSLDIRG